MEMGNAKFTVNRQEREIIMERTFDAPRELVWKVWSDPKLIPQWWGKSAQETTVDKLDFKPGGRWRFVVRDSGGTEFGFNGEFREIVAPQKVVYTFNFEPIGPGHELTEEVTFEEQGSKTKMKSKAIYQTVEDLEGMLKAGMEGGANESMDRFEELLKKQTLSK
jgi:uncharacterized protein YndB with AHSA1/START domain